MEVNFSLQIHFHLPELLDRSGLLPDVETAYAHAVGQSAPEGDVSGQATWAHGPDPIDIRRGCPEGEGDCRI